MFPENNGAHDDSGEEEDFYFISLSAVGASQAFSQAFVPLSADVRKGLG